MPEDFADDRKPLVWSVREDGIALLAGGDDRPALINQNRRRETAHLESGNDLLTVSLVASKRTAKGSLSMSDMPDPFRERVSALDNHFGPAS
jgi:hypothetical protein